MPATDHLTSLAPPWVHLVVLKPGERAESAVGSPHGFVTTVVDDSEYLTQELVISSQFKKESDLSRWNPRPCDIAAPLTPQRSQAR